MKYFVYCRKSTESEDRQVLSIASQEEELVRTFAGRPEMEIVRVFKESFSAKAPGRPIFNEMMDRLERGEADGLIAWHPDRLARNSIDGGRVIYLLDQKTLKDLKFAGFTFENNPQGKLMLSVLLGFSKYYVDALSENVKRGNRAKLARGWRPNQAPLGYLNEQESKTIVKDPERFASVRRLFDLALTGSYSLRLLMEEARRWGLRTRQGKRIGGHYLTISGIHRILTSPFYAGLILWTGKMYQGAHEPLITIGELERVKKILSRPGIPAPIRHSFPFTGLIRCGECHFMVTAEHKQNRYGKRYVYYHCTKRRLDYRCGQRYVGASHLDAAFRSFLSDLGVPESLHEWGIQQVERSKGQTQEKGAQRLRSLEGARGETTRALGNLTTLRIRDVIGDEEFDSQREALRREQFRLQEELASAKRSDQWFEPAEILLSFSNRASKWYEEGNDQVKRRIIQAVGSNPVLKDKKLCIEAKKPFIWIKKKATRSNLRAGLDAVRTLYEASDPELMKTLALVREITKECEHLSPENSAPSASPVR